MGNLISNASAAKNPTYQWGWDHQYNLVLVEKSNAEYDFEEFQYRSKKEAQEDKENFINNSIKHLETSNLELKEKIKQNGALILNLRQELHGRPVDKENFHLFLTRYRDIYTSIDIGEIKNLETLAKHMVDLAVSIDKLEEWSKDCDSIQLKSLKELGYVN